jgi:hypothetical protein
MIQVLSEVGRPIELGGLTVSGTGALSQCAPKLPLTFSFSWREMRFKGEVTRPAGKLALRLSADVAIVPFSAENTGRRQRLLSLLQAGGADGAQLSLVLSPTNTLFLLREIELAADTGLTADVLITQTATGVLESAPYLDLMVEAGFVKHQADQETAN